MNHRLTVLLLVGFAACEAELPVKIDILPGTFPNVVAERTELEVAVLAADDFDPGGLDAGSALLSDAGQTAAVSAQSGSRRSDVDGDGRPDLLLRFSVAALRQARLLTETSTRLTFRAAGQAPWQRLQVQGQDLVFLHHRQVVRLPRPTGPHPVGTAVHTFVDRDRPPPSGLDQPHRTLMLRAHYPAQATPGVQPAPYFLEEREALIHAERRQLPAYFFDGAAGWERLDVAPAPRPDRFPVLLFSPGLGASVAYYQNLLAELASHGYVVISIAHPGHAGVVVYPDGQTVLPSYGMDLQIIRQLHDQAALDLRAVARWLAAGGAPDPLTGRLDVSRLGSFGHSLGGSASADAALDSQEIRAVLNIDGRFFGLAAEGGPPRPVMFIAADKHDEVSDPSIGSFFTRRRAVAYQVHVAGTAHNNASDWGLLEPLVPPAIPRSQLNLGPLPPARALELIARQARALFDEHLQGMPSPLLRGPDPEAPEVTSRLHPAP